MIEFVKPMKLYEGYNECFVIIRRPMNDIDPRIVCLFNHISFSRKNLATDPSWVSWDFTPAMYKKAIDFLHCVGYTQFVRTV